MKYLIRDMPDELWKRFKANCVLKGASIKVEIERLIREEVEKAKKGKL